ncbi:MAG: hypothetical protein ABR611_13870 [Chthoniobacterales bacterium]
MLNVLPLINISGIVMDIVGAFLVASEIVHKFGGHQYGAGPSFDSATVLPPVETEDYKKWAHLKTVRMTRGLFLLTVGFVFQVLANALQFRMPR